MHVNFTRENIVEAMFKVSRVNVKAERVAAFTFTRDLSHVAYILFTHVKIMRYSGH